MKGFTLIELVVSLAITALVTGAVVFLGAMEQDRSRQTETLNKMHVLKHAIVGDPRIVTKEARTDFGYVGAMGSAPASLQDLWIKGSQPAFSYDSTRKTGAGWAGPYVSVGLLDYAGDLGRDAWGNGFVYTVAAGTSSLTGQEYRALITSYGADGGPEGNDDLTTEIYRTEMLSGIASYVRDSAGNPMSNVSVRIHYPVNGTLTSAQTMTAANGAYLFPNIPMGNRSVAIEPKLAYMHGTALSSQGGGGGVVEFAVLSFTCGTLESIIGTWAATAFYQRLWIGKDQVFNDAQNLAASGERITFTPVSISGDGCSSGGSGQPQIFPVRVQSAFTQLPDLRVGAGTSAGTTIRMRMEGFKQTESGGGSGVDMTGETIAVTFSDGSNATFTPVRR